MSAGVLVSCSGPVLGAPVGRWRAPRLPPRCYQRRRAVATTSRPRCTQLPLEAGIESEPHPAYDVRLAKLLAGVARSANDRGLARVRALGTERVRGAPMRTGHAPSSIRSGSGYRSKFWYRPSRPRSFAAVLRPSCQVPSGPAKSEPCGSAARRGSRKPILSGSHRGRPRAGYRATAEGRCCRLVTTAVRFCHGEDDRLEPLR